MQKKLKTIGIFGGLGPAAGSNMLKKIIKQAQKQLNAVMDTDYPPVIFYSKGFEGFDETGITDFKLVEKQLIEAVKHLEDCGAELIVIACNTVYFFYQKIQAACKVPVLHLIQETAKVVGHLPYKKIALVTSQSTSKEGLYSVELAKYPDKEIIYLPLIDQQSLLNQIVLLVMGGEDQEKIDEYVKQVVKKLKSMGAEMILVGCTELSMAFNEKNTELPLVDAVDVIAELAIKKSVI